MQRFSNHLRILFLPALVCGAGHGHADALVAGETNCDLEVRPSLLAEKEVGGALWDPANTAGSDSRASIAPPSSRMVPTANQHAKGRQHHAPITETTHMRHEPQYGGAFFMAPNKLHHVEAVYSKACGFRVVFFNAFTRSIRADRFRAFARFLPQDEELPETLCFPELSAAGSMLACQPDESLRGPFEVELYVKFPGSKVVELFNVLVANRDD